MNQAQAPGQHPMKPPLGNTGQYTISVSKPGTGEDPELISQQLSLIVTFSASEEGFSVPDVCRVDVWRDGVPEGVEGIFAFKYQDGAYVANVVMTLEADWQATGWVDLYLVRGDWEKYALSAFLSTLLTDLMTVTCTYHSDPPRHGQGE